MALVQGTGASQGRKKKKSPSRAGTQGRGGVNAPSKTTSRVVTKHVYRGVSFYSATGKTLGVEQQKGIILAAQKIPTKVWDRLAMAGTKIIVMNDRERTMAPKFIEYMQAQGIPRQDTIDSFSGEKGMAYTDKYRHPVAVVGIGGFPNREPGYVVENAQHTLLHETAHAVSMSFEVMKAVGSAYHGLERKNINSQARAMKTVEEYREQPFATSAEQMPANRGGGSRMDVSERPDFKKTIPHDYTAGYGDASRSYVPGGEPASEVFAESLAHYWNGSVIPKKMKSFFDNYFDEGW
jgi:hypothetical protein